MKGSGLLMLNDKYAWVFYTQNVMTIVFACTMVATVGMFGLLASRCGYYSLGVWYIALED